MSNDRKDDDVIVISEEDVSYESPEESDGTVDPAEARGGVFAHGDSLADGDRATDDDDDDDDLAVIDQATQDEPSTAAGRFGPATPGDAAAGPDDHPATEPVIPAGSRYGTSAQADSQSGLTTDADAIGTDAAGTAGLADVDGTAGVNGNGNGSGSAIPMPAATSAATPETPAASSTPDADWPQIQSLFVDDPHAAVKQAADVAGGALAALVAAANNREQTLRDSWQGDSTGTEDLRTALRDYRELAGRLSTLSKDL
jgi:hypothetical protein